MNDLLSLIGVLIAEYPKRIQRLLYDFDIRVTDTLREESVVQKVIYGIAYKGEAFQLKLSELIESLLSKELNVIYLPQDDRFFGVVIGAVKGISKIAKKVKAGRQSKAQANDQILAAMREQERQKVELEKQRLIQLEDNKNRIKRMKVGGGVIGLILLGFVLFKPIKKHYALHFNKPQS